MTDWSKTQHQDALRGEIARLREALSIAERERDEARTTNQRLNRRCGDYERALAEKRSLCSDGKPRGSAFSRAMLNAYLTEVLAYVEKVDAEVDELGELAWSWCFTARRELDLAILRNKLAAGEPLPCDEEGGVEMDTKTSTLVVRPGDVLEGTEGDVTTRIQVTYVSEETLLARWLWSRRSDGSELHCWNGEASWTLSCRDWRKVEDPSTRSDDHEG